MNIYTSCFSRAKFLDPARYCVVSISRFPPLWFNGVRCLSLAPSCALLKAYHDGLSWGSYVSRYQSEVLSRVDVKSVLAGVAKECHGRDMVLCCYESSPVHCHRSLVAGHVQTLYGYSMKDI